MNILQDFLLVYLNGKQAFVVAQQILIYSHACFVLRRQTNKQAKGQQKLENQTGTQKWVEISCRMESHNGARETIFCKTIDR